MMIMKKQYIIPSTCEAEMLMESMILSGSAPIPPAPGPHIEMGGETFDQLSALV